MKYALTTTAIALTLFIGPEKAAAQGMAVNATGAAANASAILDVTSNTQGMLVPRMLSSERSAITTPATGLLVFQTDGTAGFYYYTGSAWTALSGGGGSSSSGATDTMMFVGTSPTVAYPGSGFTSVIPWSNQTLNLRNQMDGTGIFTATYTAYYLVTASGVLNGVATLELAADVNSTHPSYEVSGSGAATIGLAFTGVSFSQIISLNAGDKLKLYTGWNNSSFTLTPGTLSIRKLQN